MFGLNLLLGHVLHSITSTFDLNLLFGHILDPVASTFDLDTIQVPSGLGRLDGTNMTEVPPEQMTWQSSSEEQSTRDLIARIVVGS